MKQNKEYKSQIEDVDAKGRVVVAANAIGNVDSDKDRSLNASFDKTLKENFSRLKWFLNHDKNLLLGVPVEGKQDGKYLKLIGQLNMKKQLSIDTYEDYRLYAEYGKSLEHSIGVEAVKWQMNNDIRDVSEWKLWEYSTLTSWGANWDTPLMGIKSLTEIPDAIDWLELKMRKGKFSDEKFVEIEKQLSLLRSLCADEPSIDTIKAKPDNQENKSILVIQNFVNNLKQHNDGRKANAGSS